MSLNHMKITENKIMNAASNLSAKQSSNDLKKVCKIANILNF